MEDSIKVSLQLEDQLAIRELIKKHYHFDNFIINDVAVSKLGSESKEFYVAIEDITTSRPYNLRFSENSCAACN